MYLFAAPKIEGLKLNDILQANFQLTTLSKEDSELYGKVKDYIKEFSEFGYKWTSLLTEIMYWRKANHIHYWFVENVQNGIDDNGALSEVTKEEIVELYNSCLRILSNNSTATEVLPTMPGPFFGSTAFDSLYFHETKRTLDMLQKILNSPFFEENYLLYQSSW